MRWHVKLISIVLGVVFVVGVAGVIGGASAAGNAPGVGAAAPDFTLNEQKNVVIVGVSVQDEDSHQKFCTKEGLSFKLLADTTEKVSSQYDSVMTYNDAKFSARHTFLIDPQGKVQKIWLEVKPDKHSEEVLAALTALQGASASK